MMDLDNCRFRQDWFRQDWFRQDRFRQAQSQRRQPRGSTTILACHTSLLDYQRRLGRLQRPASLMRRRRGRRRRQRRRRRVLNRTRLTSHVSYCLHPTARRLDSEQPLATLRLELLHAMREAISVNQCQSVAVSVKQSGNHQVRSSASSSFLSASCASSLMHARSMSSARRAWSCRRLAIMASSDCNQGQSGAISGNQGTWRSRSCCRVAIMASSYCGVELGGNQRC